MREINCKYNNLVTDFLLRLKTLAICIMTKIKAKRIKYNFVNKYYVSQITAFFINYIKYIYFKEK